MRGFGPSLGRLGDGAEGVRDDSHVRVTGRMGVLPTITKDAAEESGLERR